ncbi:hypothetical protein ACWC9U_30750 [Streptomyces sp. 900116325]
MNPRHLLTGTNAENSADMVERERQPAGSKNGQAKLTEAEVADIRERVAAGELHRVLAAEYGVSRSSVSRIVSRGGWKHIA